MEFRGILSYWSSTIKFFWLSIFSFSLDPDSNNSTVKTCLNLQVRENLIGLTHNSKFLKAGELQADPLSLFLIYFKIALKVTVAQADAKTVCYLYKTEITAWIILVF